MFIEMTLFIGLGRDLSKDIKADMKKDIPRMCRSKFEELEDAEKEREKLFRLLLEEVQRNS